MPRYYEIEQALRARVAKLAPGDPLPSDAELCEEFGVSRMTARNAMAQLVQAGIVRRIPGRGTFVAQQPVHRQAGSLISFSDEMRRRGRRPSSRVLDARTRAGTGVETVSLGLRSGSTVVELVRLRLADEEPIAIEASAFPPSLRRACSRAPTSRAARCSTRWSARATSPPPAAPRWWPRPRRLPTRATWASSAAVRCSSSGG